MAFLSLENPSRTIIGIIVYVGVVWIINSILEKNEKLGNLTKIIWVIFFVIILNMAAASLYWLLKTM